MSVYIFDVKFFYSRIISHAKLALQKTFLINVEQVSISLYFHIDVVAVTFHITHYIDIVRLHIHGLEPHSSPR